MPLRIVIADDHLIVREGLKALLQREGFDVVGEASDGHEAIRLTQKFYPDVVVLDLAMPMLNGLDTAQEIRKACPRTRTILLTMYAEDQYVLGALKVGITGYVLKSQASEELVQAIKDVSQGMIYLSPRVSRAVVEAYLNKTGHPSDPLTPREREVLQLVAEGKTTKEIAALLGVSIKTAESHRTRIMEKLDLHSTADLVRYAIRRGLIQP